MKDTATYTKSGFSKQGFSCCGRYNFCNMGKDDCYYDGIDNDVKNHCNCYQRKHAKKKAKSNHHDNEEGRKSRYEFNSDEVLLVKACFNSERIRMGGNYLLKEKMKYKSLTQAYVYTLENVFVGVQSINNFFLIKSVNSLEELAKTNRKKSIKLITENHEEDVMIGTEQLRLF